MTLPTIALAIGLAASLPPDGPTMGWSSWNTYFINISDTLIKRQADAMAKKGLKDAGYSFINIDDGYFGGRDADGRLLIHPTRFPSGMKPVVDHIHSLGLKAGIYSDAGRNTCGNYYNQDTIAHGVGLFGHDQTDADMFFKELGFDFIKVDFCGGDAPQNTERLDLDERERYTSIRNAIKATGRNDVRLNICRWDYPGTWVDSVGFSWRISHDIGPHWNSVKDIIFQSMPISAYCRNGGFNDMDMLEVGRGMTPDEDATHFGLWCIMSSPLLIGCDLENIDAATLALLTNPELIALNQDALHLQAYPVAKSGECYVLVKDIGKLRGKTRAFAVFNPSDEEETVTVRFKDMDLSGKVKLRNVLKRKDEGHFIDKFTVTLPPHATGIYMAEGAKRETRDVYEAETALISCYSEIRNPAASNTGCYAYDSASSCGLKATRLGMRPDNDLIWSNVEADKSGSHELAFDCFSNGDSKMKINVNGRDCGELTFNGKGTGKLTVNLKKGLNRIRLYNTDGKMPDVDKMTVTKK